MAALPPCRPEGSKCYEIPFALPVLPRAASVCAASSPGLSHPDAKAIVPGAVRRAIGRQTGSLECRGRWRIHLRGMGELSRSLVCGCGPQPQREARYQRFHQHPPPQYLFRRGRFRLFGENQDGSVSQDDRNSDCQAPPRRNESRQCRYAQGAGRARQNAMSCRTGAHRHICDVQDGETNANCLGSR
jgi:hypothetical protein